MATVSRRSLFTLLLTAGTPAATAAQQTVDLPARERALASTPATVFSIGKEEGESWELLSNVQSVAFDRQDNLYVLDAGNQRVLVFDRTGRFLRQIGKQGEGPGEITFATAMVIDANGDLVLADLGRGGYTIFGTDGSYKTTVPGSQESRILASSGFQASPRGGIVARTMPLLRPGADGPPTGPQKSPVVHQPLTDGAKPSTLFEIEIPAPRVVEQGGQGNRRTMMFSIAPPVFTPELAWGVLPSGGIAVSNSAEYAVQIIGPNGGVERVIRRGEKPRRVTNRDRDAAREQRREQMANPRGGVRVTNNNGRMSYGFGGGGGMSEAQIEEQLRNLEFADVVPLVQGIRTDVLGRIWVHRTGERAVGAGPIDLIRADGRYIGTLRGQTLPMAVSASGLAAYVERDDMDVERVVVRRLPEDWK